MIRIAITLFAVQAGFQGFTATLPVALASHGMADAQIGFVVGFAKLVQLPATIVVGALIDRWGPVRLLATAAALYIVGAALLFLGGARADQLLLLLVARFVQGVGAAAALPAALSMVPRLVARSRRGGALAIVGTAHNLSMAVVPPISLALMHATQISTVALATAAVVIVGALPLVPLARRYASARPVSMPAPDRPSLRLTFRRSWRSPLTIVLFAVVYWGIVTAYLPQRATFAGADIGLFFAADGFALVILRPIVGWAVDRIRPLYLILSGLLVTAAATGLLVQPPDTALLALAGSLTGAGGGLIITPLVAEMSWRSGDSDRGSAFALLSAAMSGGIALGSIGLAPLVATIGYEAAVAATAVGLGVAAVVTIRDSTLAHAPARRVSADELETPELG